MQVFKKKSLVSLSVWVLAMVLGYVGYQYTLNQQFAQAQEQREQLRASLGKVEDLAAAFRTVGKIVEPSVVSIDVRKKVSLPGGRGMNDDMLRRFFPDRDGDGQPDLPPGFEMPNQEDMPEQMGTGSGVIMEYSDGKGYILTNNHVAGGAEEMVVTLYDGRVIRNGKVVGADAKTDLAVVAIQADRLVPAKWGTSDELQKGDYILAFGSPFGYVGSMTHGIVSAMHRTDVGILGAGGYENFIQIDAPINPGNSGGPVVNLRGEVVGVSTAIASRSGGFQGVGFAIPSNQAKTIYTTLKDKGKVVRGWLGVSIQNVTANPRMARSFGYEGKQGVLVEEVLKDTPAAGQLQYGDIITSVNGKEVQTVPQLRGSIADLPPGAEIKMDIFRKGKVQNITMKLGEQPDDVMAARRGGGGSSGENAAPNDAGAATTLGIRVKTLTPDVAERRGLDVKSGAIISEIERNSPAAREGLRPGDVIVEVGDQQIKNANDFQAAMSKEDLKKGVRLYVASRDGSRFVFISTEK